MWRQYHDHPIYRKDVNVVERFFKDLVDFTVPGRYRPDQKRLTWYSNALTDEFKTHVKRFTPQIENIFSSYLKNRTYQDMMFETIPCCLRAEDRNCAAFGLDHRLPFFDYRLVEFMFRVPTAMKYREGVTKAVLREAMKGVLPDSTRLRVKKTGWNAPAHVWFQGKGKDQLFDLIRSKKFRDRGIYCVAEVERLIDDHDDIVTSGRPAENHMMFLWQLVNLELWLDDCHHM